MKTAFEPPTWRIYAELPQGSVCYRARIPVVLVRIPSACVRWRTRHPDVYAREGHGSTAVRSAAGDSSSSAMPRWVRSLCSIRSVRSLSHLTRVQAASARDVERYRRSFRGEINSAALYRTLAESETSTELAEVYARLAAAEERHAHVWRSRLRGAGHEPPSESPGVRVRLLGWLARRFGADTILPLVVAAEANDTHAYEGQPEALATGMPAEERSHGRVFRAIVETSRSGLSGAAVARFEGSPPGHGWQRAACRRPRRQ
jgi:rubrerythrin